MRLITRAEQAGGRACSTAQHSTAQDRTTHDGGLTGRSAGTGEVVDGGAILHQCIVVVHQADVDTRFTSLVLVCRDARIFKRFMLWLCACPVHHVAIPFHATPQHTTSHHTAPHRNAHATQHQCRAHP